MVPLSWIADAVGYAIEVVVEEPELSPITSAWSREPISRGWEACLDTPPIHRRGRGAPMLHLRPYVPCLLTTPFPTSQL